MKCKECYEQLAPADVARKRCPYCGGAIVERKKKKLPFLVWVISLPFLLLGFLFAVVGADSWLNYETGKEYHVMVAARIVEIQVEETYDSDKDEVEKDYTVFVRYEYADKQYDHVELGRHNSNMRVGDWVQVEIDTRNPGEIVSNLLSMMILGLVFMAAGAAILYFSIKRRKRLAADTVAFGDKNVSIYVA